MGTILGVLLMAGGVICLFLGGYQYWELQLEVSERLPQGQRFEPLFWTLGTRRKFCELRMQVLPSSPRPKRSLRFAIGGFCLFFPGIAILLVSLK